MFFLAVITIKNYLAWYNWFNTWTLLCCKTFVKASHMWRVNGKFSCVTHNLCMCTDNAWNLTNVLQLLSHQHIACMAHLVNLAVKKWLVVWAGSSVFGKCKCIVGILNVVSLHPDFSPVTATISLTDSGHWDQMEFGIRHDGMYFLSRILLCALCKIPKREALNHQLK